MSRLNLSLLALVTLAFAACNQGGGTISLDTGGADLGEHTDVGIDGTMEDSVIPEDTETPDLLAPDLEQPDLEQPDLPPVKDTTPDLCIPDCEGLECGDDGCGGDCGTCPSAAPLCVDGLCEVECVPVCEFDNGDPMECGDDGCGGDCGTCPGAAPFCVDHICVLDCNTDCEDKECGDDGCGGSCGTCEEGWACVEFVCQEICVPICELDDGTPMDCGDDGCGGSCGDCAEGLYCVEGLCAEECVSDEGCDEAELTVCTEDFTGVFTCQEVEDGCFQWSEAEDCEADHHCDEGACVPDCVPDCDGKDCGTDGCGGDCGTCDGAQDVCQEGLCVCVPNCDGKDCGPDGCVGSCGECIGAQDQCQENLCVCVPDCDGKICGADGCGGDCGTCPGAQDICQEGLCLCVPSCEGKLCGGDDGCAGVCDGPCDPGFLCEDYVCVPECVPACDGKDCGSDGCGGDCGTCPGATVCSDQGLCQTICDLNCVGKACGPDGCGGACGYCEDGFLCSDSGLCVEDCTPTCDGKDCGPDGCGGSCGDCDDGLFCEEGACSLSCTPDCQYLECGDDGCGGSCGDCDDGLICTASGLCGGECTLCTGAPECADLDFAEGTLGSWEIDAAQVIPAFGGEAAPTGGFMLKLTTGEGLTEADSHAVFQTCIPPGNYAALITRKVYSSEFIEWCGSNFQDSFHAWADVGDQGFPLSSTTIDDLCPPDACDECGDEYVGLEESEVELDTTGVWETPWHLAVGAVTVDEGEQLLDLHLEASDAGDTIYDSVLLVDRVRFIPCTEYCAEVDAACGPSPCGGTCGTCGLQEECLAGQCVCIPDCAGKECGADGCGGSCGACEGVQQECQGGICVCVPDCDGKECGNDGCGGLCGTCDDGLPCTTDGCQSDGTCLHIENGCCMSDDDCDDEDPCTDDACVDTLCQWTPSDSPDCCKPLHYVEDFDDGEAQGWSFTTPVNSVGWGVWSQPLQGDSPALYYGNPAAGDFDAGTTSEGAAVSPLIALAPNQAWALSFDVYMDTETSLSFDQLTLWVSWDGGPWVLLWDKGDYVQTQTWQEVSLDLSALAGTTTQFMFNFDTQDSLSNDGLGVLVDEFSVLTTCAAPTCQDAEDCSADLPGSAGTCEGGVCAWAMPTLCVSNTECADNDPCTEDACQGGVCISTAYQDCCHNAGECDDGDLCTEDLCEPSYVHPICDFVPIDGCCNDDTDCDDGELCTQDICPLPGEQCINQEIQGCCIAAADCDDGDPCTLEVCVDNTCQHEDICCATDDDCDDGKPCTDDVCSGGFCDNPWVGGPGCCHPPIFRDDFAADLGWTWDNPWERGPAVSDVNGAANYDPANDHSSSDDNYLAGVVIGGLVPTALGDWIWLTSPAFDTSAAAAPTLSYWRWLKSDYTPYMQNRVQVWNGATWQTLWESGSYPGINDTTWTFLGHDLTAYKGAQTRVRFGYKISSTGVFNVAGWSLDDVQVRDADMQGEDCCDKTSDCQGIHDPAACINGVCL